MWLLPSLRLGPVLIFWFCRTDKYSRTPGGVTAGSCLPTPATMWTDCCKSLWFKLRKSLVHLQVQTEWWLSPCSARVPWWSCPHPVLGQSPGWWCFLTEGATGRPTSGGATSYQLCSTQWIESVPFCRWAQWSLSDSAGPRTNGFWLQVHGCFYSPSHPKTTSRRHWQVLKL